MDDPGTLLVEDRERVRYLTLNRPEKRNALTPGQLEDLFAAFLDAEADDRVGAVVLRGAGKAFYAGIDLDPSQMDLGFDDRSLAHELRLLDSFRRFEVLWNLRTPVVASVHGYCLGAGTDLAFHSDITICAEDAQFGYPPVRSMTSPPTHMWTYLAGPQWAKRLLLTGDTVDGRTAERAGFVLAAVPADRLAEETHELASKMARVPPDVSAQNKAICNKVLDLMGRSVLQQLAREANAMAHQSPDAMEFGRRVADGGLKAALAWQEEKFR